MREKSTRKNTAWPFGQFQSMFNKIREMSRATFPLPISRSPKQKSSEKQTANLNMPVTTRTYNEFSRFALWGIDRANYTTFGAADTSVGKN